VQKITISLLRQLTAIRQMSNVRVHIKEDKPGAPIMLIRRHVENDGSEYWSEWGSISIQDFLSFDITAAIAAGGTIGDLMRTQNKRRPPRWDMEPLETVPLDEALSAIGWDSSAPQSK
jgi:hypothetical protein